MTARRFAWLRFWRDRRHRAPPPPVHRRANGSGEANATINRVADLAKAADDQLADARSREPLVRDRAARTARLLRENHLADLVDRALEAGS